MKKTIARLITLILTTALLITFVAVTPVNAATTPKSAATTDEETPDYKEALKDLKAGIKARNKILMDDGTLSEAFKAEYEAVADYEEAKYGGGPLLDFLANSCVTSLKQIATTADLSDLEEEEQKELQPYIESEIRNYLTIVDILEKKFDVEIDDFQLPEEEDQKTTSNKGDVKSSDQISDKSKDSSKASKSNTTVTKGMKNALGKAEVYLSFYYFSYAGLVEQLQFEGYTAEEAEYAADHCGADWKEQAVGKGKIYMQTADLSYTRLIEQLQHDGFTAEEAEYAVDQIYE